MRLHRKSQRKTQKEAFTDNKVKLSSRLLACRQYSKVCTLLLP